MRPHYIHSFAKYRLQQNNIKFYHKGKRILAPVVSKPEGLWEYPKFETYLIKGRPLIDKTEFQKNRIAKSYEELIHKTGLIISSKRPSKMRFRGQKTEYYITRPSQFINDVGEIPRSHHIEFDLQNYSVRLLGPNSMQEWVTYKLHRTAGYGIYGRKGEVYEKEPSYEDLMEEFMPTKKAEIEEKFYIKNDIVIGIGMEGYWQGKLVCIPEENFNPVIFINGQRRMGKTLLECLLLDNLFHNWKKKCIVMDDPLKEFDVHCLEWKEADKQFTRKLDLVGLRTRALPLVFLHPITNTLRQIMLGDEVGYKISLPFKEMILDYENFLQGKDSWTFKNSGVYFRNLIYNEDGSIKKDGLINAKSFEQIKFIVNDKLIYSGEDQLVGEQKKTPSGVIPKIINVLQDIYNSNILDISNNHKPKWDVEFPDESRKKYYPWSACLIADIIPLIATFNIRKHNEYYPQYMKFIMEDIFRNQMEDEYFIKNNSEIFMFFPEITSVVDSKKPTVANDTFEQIVRESGPARIGVVFDTQFYDRVPETPKSQANYVISFRQRAKTAKELVEDFDSFRTVKSDLLSLKKFQCVCFTTSKFHIYDEEGNKEIEEDTPIKIQTLPSLSEHKAPKKVGEV